MIRNDYGWCGERDICLSKTLITRPTLQVISVLGEPWGGERKDQVGKELVSEHHMTQHNTTPKVHPHLQPLHSWENKEQWWDAKPSFSGDSQQNPSWRDHHGQSSSGMTGDGLLLLTCKRQWNLEGVTGGVATSQRRFSTSLWVGGIGSNPVGVYKLFIHSFKLSISLVCCHTTWSVIAYTTQHNTTWTSRYPQLSGSSQTDRWWMARSPFFLVMLVWIVYFGFQTNETWSPPGLVKPRPLWVRRPTATTKTIEKDNTPKWSVKQLQRRREPGWTGGGIQSLVMLCGVSSSFKRKRGNWDSAHRLVVDVNLVGYLSMSGWSWKMKSTLWTSQPENGRERAGWRGVWIIFSGWADLNIIDKTALCSLYLVTVTDWFCDDGWRVAVILWTMKFLLKRKQNKKVRRERGFDDKVVWMWWWVVSMSIVLLSYPCCVCCQCADCHFSQLVVISIHLL